MPKRKRSEDDDGDQPKTRPKSSGDGKMRPTFGRSKMITPIAEYLVSFPHRGAAFDDIWVKVLEYYQQENYKEPKFPGMLSLIYKKDSPFFKSNANHLCLPEDAERILINEGYINRERSSWVPRDEELVLNFIRKNSQSHRRRQIQKNPKKLIPEIKTPALFPESSKEDPYDSKDPSQVQFSPGNISLDDITLRRRNVNPSFS